MTWARSATSLTSAVHRMRALVSARTLARIGALVLAHGGCGPDVATSNAAATGSGGESGDVAEPVEVQAWMLGVFSNREPVERTDYAGVQHYYVHGDLKLEYIDATRGLDPCGFGTAEECILARRSWEPRAEDSFAMFPAEEELGSIVAEFLVRPQPGRSTACGPYEVVTIVGPDGDFPGPQPNPEVIIRGTVCQGHVPCPMGSEDTEGCGGYEMAWCDQPPPPCERE